MGVPVSSSASRPNSRLLAHLDDLLNSRLFKPSKRCCALLQYVVVETLAGRADRLKERTIGVEVFGRKPDYDTNTDTIVRSAAVELRKHLARYYETAPGSAIRIYLPSGAYVPEFQLPEEGGEAQSGSADDADRSAAPLSGIRTEAARRAVPWWRRKTALLSLGGVAVLALALWMVGLRAAPDPVRSFWGPVWDRAGVLTLVLGSMSDNPPKGASGEGPTIQEAHTADRIGFADSIALARVAALTRFEGKRFEIRRGGSLALQDMRKQPAVVIGAINSMWTKRLGNNLRFTFSWDLASGTGGILDRQQENRLIYRAADSAAPYSSMAHDRAIISRFHDPLTEQPVVLLEGLGREGTTAASEFVTEPRYLGQLGQRAPKGWRNKDLQVIIETDIVNGNAGPPRIVAIHVW